jgi:carbamoylphosphate synthase large subunit
MSSQYSDRPALVLLSGGSLVGQNVMQALGTRRGSFLMVATSSVADEPSLADFDEVRLVPETKEDPSAVEAHLMQLVEELRPVLVIPCRDEDVALLADLAERDQQVAGIALCGTRSSAEVMLDKWKSWLFSRSEGLPFAPCILPCPGPELDAFLAEHDLPVIVKPRRGFASRGVSLLYEEAQVRRVDDPAEFVLQKYVGDPAGVAAYLERVESIGVPLFHSLEEDKISLQMCVFPDGTVSEVVCTRHEMRNGVSVAVELLASDEAGSIGMQASESFARAGWRGPLNVQCQRTPSGELLIYEFNGRFTGATAARAQLGVDEVGMALQRFAQVDIAPEILQPTSRVVRRLVSRPVGVVGGR